MERKTTFAVSSPEPLGESEVFLEFQERLARVAPVDRPVLLLGERGTGKELAATRLHFLSRRWQGPFVTLNCATLSPSLIESELFGYEKGAFTGAEKRRSGRFEAADGGTLFLDEIGSIPLEAQEKILRVVEYGSFERVGGSIPVEVDVRIVGATNADLVAMADRGDFKRDLLDRLSFEVLFLPPLRSRGEDIMLLANHFAMKISYELERDKVPRFSKSVTKSLQEYSWHGNIRELKNVVERAVYRFDGGVITEIVFDPFISPFSHEQQREKDDVSGKGFLPCRDGLSLPVSLKSAVAELEVKLLQLAMKQAGGNGKKAARLLSLTYDQFRGKIKKYGKGIF